MRIYIQRGGYTFKEALSCKNTILVFIVNLVELKSNSHIHKVHLFIITVKDHWEDYELDTQHNSHMDDDYGYRRYVSIFDSNTVADCQQLLVALGSLSSNVEQYMPHYANCVRCKNNKRQDLVELLADSSALLNFTHE